MLAYLVIVPIIIAVLLSASQTKAVRLAAIAAQAGLVCFAGYIFYLSRENEITTSIGSFDNFLGISLRADTLASVFIIITAFVFMVATIYSFSEQRGWMFWFFLFIWEALMMGIFLTRDLFNAFVLVEVAVVAVAILITFKRDHRSMHDGMLYLMINTVAIQFYIFGIGYIYKLTGVLDMYAAAERLAALPKSSLYLPYALIMTPICLKCAIIPLFSWLPKAHGTPGAPTSVSALLSGIHIKSGVYLFIRIQPLFSQINLSEFFLALGLITGVVGFIFAISQSDIKLILAYHTISQVGMIIAGLSIADAYSNIGALYHVVNHAFFKAGLFLCAGVLIKAYDTRNIYEIRGVLKQYPIIGVATIISVLGITGAPLFNGSISKYFILSGTTPLISSAFIIINLGTIISFIKYSTILFGHSSMSIHNAHCTMHNSPTAALSAPDRTNLAHSKDYKVEKCKQAAVLILSVMCFVGGIFGEQFIRFLFNIDVDVDAAGYLEKAAIFAASAAAGYLLYRFYVKNSKLIKSLSTVELGFRGMCACMGIVFTATLIAARLL